MFIAKNNDLVIDARETKEELLANLSEYDVYTSIEETDTKYVFDGSNWITNEEFTKKERERISMLSLTAADVERAIYKAKGLDFDDIIAFIEQSGAQIDIKALKIELRANNFYRGNPYIEQVGTLLGFTSEQLDEFFETNDYTKLLPPAEDNSNGVDEPVENTGSDISESEVTDDT